VYLGTVGSKDTVKVTDNAGGPVVYASGYLLFVRDRALIAQPFDSARGRLTGDPKTIFGEVADGSEVSATASGLLAISEHTSGARAVWLDRAGHELSSFKVPRVFSNFSLSPDSTQALATSNDSGFLVLWKLDLVRNVSTRLVSNAGFPAWAPDGVHFAFISVGTGGPADMLVRSTMGTDQAVLLKSDDIKVVTDYSPDGHYVVFQNNRLGQLWMVPTAGDHKPFRLVNTGGRTASGRVSPDGRWLAYVSDETGTPEVYLESFPDLLGRQQLSTDGGTQPVWSRDSGRELFYLSADRRLMSVATPSSIHASPGKPQPLFPMPGVAFGSTKDGRLLSVVRDPGADHRSITVLANWTSAIK
jgi:Tol biopolymer transport system component